MSKEQKNELSVLLVRHKAVLIRWAVIAVLVIAGLLAIFFRGYSNAAKKYKDMVAELQQQIEELSAPTASYTIASREVMMDLIQSEMNDIGELATIEYFYTDAGKFEDVKQIFGVNVPFTTKTFIAKWDGMIKVGVKIEKIEVEIEDAKKEIVIHMPPAEILSHEIDSESIETLDERNGLFNKITVENIREFDAISKEAMEERAMQNGVLDKAFENAKKIIEKLVNHDVVQEQGYTIRFETE